MRARVLPALLALLLVACGDDKSPAPPSSASSGTPGTSVPTADHGRRVDMGRTTIAGHEFSVTRMGDVVPGKEAAFEVALVKGPAGAQVSTINLYASVESETGAAAGAPAKGSVEGEHLHFHITPRADAKDLKRLVLRLRAEGIDERASLPLSGHGHEHPASPHEGVVAPFRGPDGKVAGHLELKLHDDKGDLELWLAKDERISEPFDLPLASTVRVRFVDVAGRTVELAPRNREKNEDEDERPNARDGRTNYFIFPGETGADAAWLVGAEFSSVVQVTFDVAGAAHSSDEFMLVPHTHADGHEHR